MWRADSFLALPEDVIAFAWSAPMRDLAARVDISDVGLKKLLRSQGIPTPPQGHWNRVHARRKVDEPPCPMPRGPGGNGRTTLDSRFRDHVPVTGPLSEEGPFATIRVPEHLSDLRRQEIAAFGRVVVPKDLSRPSPGLARLLKSEAARRDKMASSRWQWDEPRFDTPLGRRQLHILNGLFRALERRGHKCDAWEDNHELRGRCTIGDETLSLRFGILGRHSTELRSGYHRPARDLPSTTAITLGLDRTLREPLTTSWTDVADSPIEKRLGEVCADLVVAAEASFRQSLVEARERQEERLRWEEERRQTRLRELSGKRMADLERSGDLLRRAEEIRALVSRVESAMLKGSLLDVTSERISGWKSWALDQADRIDPVLSGQVMDHLHVAELDDDDFQ